MSESLNFADETSISGNIVEESNVPPFDIEAAKAAREQRIAEYKAEYPDAIDDVNKAHAMALEGDKFRTKAADSEERAKRNLKRAKEYVKQGNTDLAKAYLEAAKVLQDDTRDNNLVAETLENSAGRKYDREHNSDNTDVN